MLYPTELLTHDNDNNTTILNLCQYKNNSFLYFFRYYLSLFHNTYYFIVDKLQILIYNIAQLGTRFLCALAQFCTDTINERFPNMQEVKKC